MPLNDLIGYFEQLLTGAVITVELAFSGYALALTVGVAWALLRRLGNPVVTAVWRVYGSIFMGVPSVLVIFPLYYGGSAIVGGPVGLIGLRARVDVTPFLAGLAALTIVQGAYAAEVVSGATRNVPRGQFEAARALGIRPYQAWWYVIRPQVARLALPGLTNIWISVLKERHWWHWPRSTRSSRARAPRPAPPRNRSCSSSRRRCSSSCSVPRR